MTWRDKIYKVAIDSDRTPISYSVVDASPNNIIHVWGSYWEDGWVYIQPSKVIKHKDKTYISHMILDYVEREMKLKINNYIKLL